MPTISTLHANQNTTLGSARHVETSGRVDRPRFARSARTIGWNSRAGSAASACNKRRRKHRNFLRSSTPTSASVPQTHTSSSQDTGGIMFTYIRRSSESLEKRSAGKLRAMSSAKDSSQNYTSLKSSALEEQQSSKVLSTVNQAGVAEWSRAYMMS